MVPEMISMRIPADVHAAIKEEAQRSGRTWIGQLRMMADALGDPSSPPVPLRSSSLPRSNEVKPMFKKGKQ